MPYLRPDRTGLPNPPSEDGDNASEMPRSESYLRLSELATPSVSSHAAESTQPDPHVQLKISRTALRGTTSKFAVPTSPGEERSPKRNSTYRLVDYAEDVNPASLRSSSPVPSASPLPLLRDVIMECSPSQGDDSEVSSPQKSYHSPQDPNYPDSADHEKETMIAVSKRLVEQDVHQGASKGRPEKQRRQDTPAEMTPKSKPEYPQSPVVTPEKPRQKPPPVSPKPSFSPPRQSPSSPKAQPISPKLPPKIPRSAKFVSEETVMSERPVELKRMSSVRQSRGKPIQTEEDVDSPVPLSTNTSSKHSAEKESLVVMPVTLSNPPSPIATPKSLDKDQNIDSQQSVKPQIPVERASTSPSKRVEKKDDVAQSTRRESLPQIAMVEPSPPPPALVRAKTDTKPISTGAPVLPPLSSGNNPPASTSPKRTTSKIETESSRPVSSVPPPLSESRRASKQFIPPIDSKQFADTTRTKSGISQQSAAAHMATRQGHVLQTVCYGPVQFADIAEAYNESAAGRTVLDYPLLKRLDEAIFHRSDENSKESVTDGTIKSFIVTAEMRLLLVVQQFMITAALLPAHKRVFEGDVEPDPLIKFVDDAEALVQYMLFDIQHQPDLFSPSTVDLEAFVQERVIYAHSSQDASFYFRHQVSDVTMKYVQGLCETICGLWPNGKFFIGAEGVNPRDSFTPAHFHHKRSSSAEAVASQFDKYFHDPGLLGHVVATDYRQLFRGAFPFIKRLETLDESARRPDREREMCVDAWFVEKGVFRFENTTFVREHLLVDSNRRIRIYVDDFDGTRYLVYYNHRIGRLLGLSHLGFEILQTYNILFFSNWRSRRIAQRLGLNISSIEQFDPMFLHPHIFEAPRVSDLRLFRCRLCLLQHRLSSFRPEHWGDLFRGGYMEPLWPGVVWFMIIIVLLVLSSIIATVLVNVLLRDG